VAIHKRPNKGLLAGLYELPMLEGHQGKDEVIDTLQKQGMYPIRIEKLPDAVHIFSHKEWHMKAYAVRIDELSVADSTKAGYLFVHPKETEEKYPSVRYTIPYAKAVYSIITVDDDGISVSGVDGDYIKPGPLEVGFFGKISPSSESWERKWKRTGG
jgi:adenine-specific DNA glycosylase